MRYLVTMRGFPPFSTPYFDAPNHFVPDSGMVVFDIKTETYTDDGKNWKLIKRDKL